MSFISRWRSDVQTATSAYKGLGIVGTFFSWGQGRATTFAMIFTVVGIIGFFKHFDLSSYSLFVTAIQAGVVGHSIKEDYFEMRHRQIDTQPAVDVKTSVDVISHSDTKQSPIEHRDETTQLDKSKD